MQAIFEYVPLIIFFVIYKFVDIYWATGALIITSALHILYFIIRKEPVPMRNWVFFGIIAVFGGLTIFLHDDTFLKWKVSIINMFFALALLISNHLFNKNIIKQFLGESLQLPEKIWNRLNFSWAMFFILCSILNLYVAFSFEQEVWVNFKVFGLTGLTFIFAIGSIISLYKHFPKEEHDNAPISENKSHAESVINDIQQKK